MSSTASGWTWEESRTNTPPLDFTAMKYVSQRLYSLDASLHRGTASSGVGLWFWHRCWVVRGGVALHGHWHTPITHLLIVDLWSRTVPAFVRYA